MGELCNNNDAETAKGAVESSFCRTRIDNLYSDSFLQAPSLKQVQDKMQKSTAASVLPVLIVGSSLLAAAPELERRASQSSGSTGSMDWTETSKDIFKSPFDQAKTDRDGAREAQKPEPKISAEPRKPSPWQSNDNAKPTQEQKLDAPRAPEERMKSTDKIAEPIPIFLDQKIRNGEIDLQSINGQDAAKVIAALPELFRLEGMRELQILTASDAQKPQVYVSQDLDAFRRQYPSLTVYGSIQQAVDHAPRGSVVNVLPGPSTSSYPKGRPYVENVSIRRSDLVIKTNERMPASIEGGGFSIGSGINDVKILNFNFSEFSERNAAIRIEGESNSKIIIGGNYFYSAQGAEAVGVYGTGSRDESAIRDVYLLGNVIGKDRELNSLPLALEGKRLEATPFNGNVKNIVAVGNLYFGTRETPLNLGLDFIGGESVARGPFNQARDGFAAYNYGSYIGRGGYWSAGAAYIDGAAGITAVLNMSEESSLCGEIGAERANAQARDNTFSGNICKSNSAHWIAVGAPSRNGASVSGSRIEKNIVIDQNREKNGENPREPHIQNNAGISRAELDARNLFFDNDLSVSQLPRHLIELYQFYRKKP